MDKHLQSQSHVNRLIPKVIDGASQLKFNKYNTFKDEYNCFCKCYRTEIPDIYLTTLVTLVRHAMRLHLTKINYANIVIQLKI